MYLTALLGYGGVLSPGLPYFCHAIAVDNPGWQWVHVPSENAWIAPFTQGAVVSLSIPTTTPFVDTIPPVGALVQPSKTGTVGPIRPVYAGLGNYTQVGDLAQIRFIEKSMASIAGIPIPITSRYTAQILFQASGVPVSDPYDIIGPTTYQELFGAIYTGVYLDLVNVTLAFQSAAISLDTVTVQAQFDNAPLLPIPPNGILQQSFAPGMARITVGSFPFQLPKLTMQSASGGSVSLTAGTQSVRAQATVQLAIV